MIMPQSHAYYKNKCNLILRSDGGADLLTWCLNIHIDYSFAIPYVIRRMLGSPWEDHWWKSRRKGDKTVQENTLESR